MAAVTGRLNGHAGDYLRWLIGVGAAGLVAYFTTISTIESGLAAVREREENHFEEVLRRLDQVQADIREIRNRPLRLP